MATKPRGAALAKTSRPRLIGVLPRKRVFALLDGAREHPAVWVAGPPGCGKTTAVASYLDHAGLDCLWYQLDPGDADVATFFYYLGRAAAEHGKGDRLPLLTPEYHAALAVFTRRYFQALYARLKPPFVVVFDGYHEVPAYSQFHAVMRDALTELPRGGCALVVSRGDPPPEMARLRAGGELALLGWDDLRLTPEETALIARQRQPKFPDEAIESLYAKTQGWAAGLVLVLEQEKMSGAIADAPELSTNQLVFDYLAGEIFQKTDAGTQELLLRTAYLAHMTADMAEAVTGDARAGRMLAELHRNNYFVGLRQARPESVYQYHPMFREFLLARVQETYPKERRRQLQKAAAATMEAAGQVEEAVALYRESHQWTEMARVIVAHAESVLAQGRGETLARWAEDLPPEVREQHPWIEYWAAASQAQLAPREARVRYEKAFELFRTRVPQDVTGMALAASGAMDAILYELDDFSLLDRWIAVIDAAEKAGVSYPSPAVEARVACSMVFSLTLRQPHRSDLEHWVGRALERARGAADPNLRMFVGLLCSLTLTWTGLYAKAMALIEAIRAAAAAPGITPFSLITLKNVEAMYFMLTADHESGLRTSEEGLRIARTAGVHTWTFQLLVYGYGSALGAGDLEAAAGYVQQLEPLAGRAGRLDQCLFSHFRAWEAMLRKDLMRALQYERTALRLAIEAGCPYFEALCRLALAEVLAECGDERKCVAHLRELRRIVESIDNRHLEFTCLIGVGRLALDHGRQRAGLNALHRGLTLGRECGFTHFLWWRPQAMARVCAQALDANIEPEYAKDLIRRRSLAPERPPLQVKGWPWSFRVRTLGPFTLLRHEAPLEGTGKAQRRPLEMLKVLIACGGDRVSEDRVTGALWPRIDGDSAHRSFTSTLHRLRKLLGEDRSIVLHEGKLTLDPRYFWTDLWAFDDLVAQIEAAFAPVRPALDPRRIEDFEARLLDLYRGPFLGAEPEEAWQLERRERSRSRFTRAVGRLGRWWEQAGCAERTRELYEKAFENDPLARPAPALSDK